MQAHFREKLKKLVKLTGLVIVLQFTSYHQNLAIINGVKKILSTLKLCFYYFSHNVSNDINVTGIHKTCHT